MENRGDKEDKIVVVVVVVVGGGGGGGEEREMQKNVKFLRAKVKS